jgi:hypothetical protein
MEEAVKQLTDIPAINRFLSYCRVRTVPSKTALIHAGDLPDVLYYIIRGSVEVMIEDEDGNEMVLAYLNKGQFFGEMGLFSDSQQRSAWVRTRSQCEARRDDLSALPPGGIRESQASCSSSRPSSRPGSTVRTASSATSPSSTSRAALPTRSWTSAASRTR